MRLFTDFYTGFKKGIAQKNCHAELFQHLHYRASLQDFNNGF